MGVYRNGQHNEVGSAYTGEFVALWNPDTPYIEVLDRQFFEQHAEEIMAAWELGGTWSDDQGNVGSVDVINTDGDLDDDGMPLMFETPDEYVASELRRWSRDSGVDTGVELLLGNIAGTTRRNAFRGL